MMMMSEGKSTVMVMETVMETMMEGEWTAASETAPMAKSAVAHSTAAKVSSSSSTATMHG